MSHHLFEEHFSGPIFLRKLLTEVGRMGRCLNNFNGTNGLDVQPNELGGLDISPDISGSIDLSEFSFGWIRAEGAKAIIRGGYFKSYGIYLRVGDSENEVSCGGSSDSRHIIVAEVKNNIGVIYKNSLLESTFSGDTADAIRIPLYAVYLYKGVVHRDEILHVGGLQA